MKPFNRIFKYVWPQWPRIVVAFISAVIVSALLSLTFMTLIPLLKVMMGEEGLHGWVDRKLSEQRYDIKFYVPEKADFTESDIAFYLLVTDVASDSAAAKAGLAKLDRIIGVNQFLVSDYVHRFGSSELLSALASADGKSLVTVQVRRFVGEMPEIKTFSFNAGPRAFYQGVVEALMSMVPPENTPAGKTRAVIVIIVAVGIITLIRCLAKFYQAYLGQKVMQVGINRLREDTFGHLVEMPVGYFRDERPSDTISRIVRDTSTIGNAIKVMFGKALREPLNAIFLLAWAMLLSWQLTLIFLCSAPLVVGLLAVFGRKMKRATRKSLVAAAQMLAKIKGTVSGLKVVKVCNQQGYERESFSRINNRLLKQLLKISKVDAATSPIMEVLGMSAGGIAIIFGAHWVAEKQIDASEFLILIALFGTAAESVRKMSTIWNRMQEANAAAERVFSIMDEQSELESAHAVELPRVSGKIEFRDVVFTYPGADNPALNGVNLTIETGKTVAIVGANGSGKTTLANLIPRFYDPDSGQVLIDNEDIRVVTLESLRDQIGMVTQNTVTFNDSIWANIGYGRRGATVEQIVDAARRSYADEFILPLAEGYDTVIGEDGTGLSGGQLQRIVIARAIVKDPAILIFDEATSQIDADSEVKIHRAIEEVMHDRTCLIIAHRFSTVMSADMIVVMDRGHIVAQGRHQELIETCSLYQSLYETQLVKA